MVANELFDERMTKLRDITFVKNPAMGTFQRSATLCERSNQLKSEYFKLDLLIGKLALSKHPLFIEEDNKAIELKTLLKEYKQKTDLTIIPHIRTQLIQLDEAVDKLQRMPDRPLSELDLLFREREVLAALLEKETTELRDLMFKTYTAWEELKRIRDTQKYSSTTVRLNARQYRR